MKKIYRICLSTLWLMGGAAVTSCNYTPIEKLAYIDLKAGFFASKPIAREGEQVQFNQTATTVAKSFEWNFGDGKTSTEQNPTNTYTKYGRYKVTLTVRKEDKVLVNTFQQDVIVLPPTEWLTKAKIWGDIATDEQGFCFTPIVDLDNAQKPITGYLLAGRQGVKTLRLMRLKANLDIENSWDTPIDIDNITQGNITPRSIVQTRDTSFVIVGSFVYNPQDDDAFMVKIANNPAKTLAKEKWRIIRNTTQKDNYTSLVEYNDNFLVGGSTVVKDIQGNNTTKLLVETYNKKGILQKSDIYGSNWQINAADFGTQGFAFALTEGTEGNSKPSLIFYSTSFVEKRKKTLTFLDGKATDVSTTTNSVGADAGQIMVGNYVEPFTDLNGNTIPNVKHAFITRLNDFGFLQWTGDTEDKKVRKINFYQEEFIKVLQMKEAGKDVFIAIGTHQNPLTGKDILVCKYDADGVLLKYRLIGQAKDDEAFDAKIISDTDFILFGTTQATMIPNRRDFYLLQLNKNLE